MGLFSVNKSSSSTNNATTNNYDQRQVNDASGGGVMGSGDTTNSRNNLNSGNSWLDLTTLTTSNVQDTHTNTSAAYSNSGNTSNVGTDAARINDTNAALLSSLGQQQGDSMRVIAGLGADGIRQMGESATNLFGQAEQNSAQVWTNTLSASQDALDKMFSAASSVVGAGTTLAQGAMATYQPADSKASDNQTKIAILGVIAIIVAAMIQKKG